MSDSVGPDIQQTLPCQRASGDVDDVSIEPQQTLPVLRPHSTQAPPLTEPNGVFPVGESMSDADVLCATCERKTLDNVWISYEEMACEYRLEPSGRSTETRRFKQLIGSVICDPGVKITS